MSKISKLAICTLEKMLLELSRSLATSIITNTSFTQKVDLSFTLERVVQLLMSANEHIKRIWDPAYKSSFSSLCLMDFIKIMQADRSLIMSNSLGYVSKFCLHYADNYSYNDVLCYDHIILHTIGENIQNISNYDTINNYEIISERLLANITVGTESLFKPIYFNEKMPGRPPSWKWSPQKTSGAITITTSSDLQNIWISSSLMCLLMWRFPQ